MSRVLDDCGVSEQIDVHIDTRANACAVFFLMSTFVF